MAAGAVPKPPVWEQHTTGVPDQSRYAGDVPRRPIVGTCTHTMVGGLIGTNNYFRGPGAVGLTDYGIGGPWDGQGWNGAIIEWIDPAAAISPYANGKVGEARAAYGDAARFIARFGIEPAVNADVRSIEHSDAGLPERMDRPWDGQVDMSCLLKAWVHFTVAGQRPDAIDWHLYHAETGTSHQGCPGPWFWANAEAVVARTVEIGRAYIDNVPLARPLTIVHPPGYTGPRVPTPAEYWAARGGPVPPPRYAKPLPPPDYQGIDVLDVDQRAWSASPHTYKVKAGGAPRLQAAAPDAKRVGPDIAAGIQFDAIWEVHGIPYRDGSTETANDLYAVTIRGSRIPQVLCEIVK